MPLDYQMVKFNLAHLNAFAALPLGCVTLLGAGTFLLFNQPTEAAQLRDKQKVKTTLHHDTLHFYTVILFCCLGFLPPRHVTPYALFLEMIFRLTVFSNESASR